MRTRAVSTMIIFASIFSLSAVLLFAYSNPANNVVATDSTSSFQDKGVEYPKIPTDFVEFDSTQPIPVRPNSDSIPDGPSIIASRCTKCHAAQLLNQTEKQRAEWELTLAQMDRMGVHLSDSEKDILLDYLTASDDMP